MLRLMATTEKASDFASKRLASLDALRGFDMFWIIGGAGIMGALAKLVNQPWLTTVSDNLTEHVEWEGFHFHDMIFPLFLFIIGVALPFSMAKRVEQGARRRDLFLKVLRRTVGLIALGLVYSGLLRFEGWQELRLFGVLQRLALGYFFAALSFIWLKPRGQAILAGAILLGYWAILALVPVAGHPLGSMTPEGNVANAFDRMIMLPGQMYEAYGDPEGPLSTIPAIATALMGVLAGHWLRTDRTGTKKALGLALAGVGCLAVGAVWGLEFPVIKKIWTSSYALVAGGWSLLLLALFYYVIDVKGWKGWAAGFVVIGLNPITIYLGQVFIDFGKITDFFFKGALGFTGALQPLLWAIAAFGVKWLLLLFLHRQRIYLRV